MKNPSVVWYAAPEKPLGAGELAEVLGLLLTTQPKVKQALRQVLGERLGRASLDSMDTRLTERAAGHGAGRMAELASLQNELASYESSET